MAHKYQADAIAAAAFNRIEMLFLPRDKNWIDPSLTWNECIFAAESRFAITLECEDAVQAANLAHLFNKPLMLPMALYMCCLLDPLQLRNGVARDGGTLEKLSDEDCVRCMNAIPAMTGEVFKHLQRTLQWTEDTQPQGCADVEKCKEAAKNAAVAAWEHPISLKHLFLRADKRGRPRARPYGPGHCLTWACPACRAQRLEHSTRMCRLAWLCLPTWLSLQPLQGWR